MSPGACDFAFFPHPGAFTGFGTEVLLCPLITGGTDLLNHVTPANGVWLQTGAKTVGPFSWFGPTTIVVRHLHGLEVQLAVPRTLAGSNFVSVVVRRAGSSVSLLLGLGRTPGIAAAILSSIRLSAG